MYDDAAGEEVEILLRASEQKLLGTDSYQACDDGPYLIIPDRR